MYAIKALTRDTRMMDKAATAKSRRGEKIGKVNETKKVRHVLFHKTATMRQFKRQIRTMVLLTDAVIQKLTFFSTGCGIILLTSEGFGSMIV
jgi:hypothetical protein